MSKVIEIKSCQDCPHFSHTGKFTNGGAKPCCDHPKTVELKGDDCFKRVIPYKNDYDVPFPPHKVPKKIPDWCPLESTEDFCESNFKI